jgi:FKBP-type peptidyl-prolyl cis-trans isomerase FkpA
MRQVRGVVCAVAATAVALVVAGCGSTPTSPSVTANVPYSQTDLAVGSGTAAAKGNTVTVNYTGWLYDANQTDNKGQQFDTSIGRGPFTFALGAGQVIAGWDQGVAGMKVGGTRRLVIPPSLGYGSMAVGSIPANSTLVFDIQLLGVS